MPYKVNLETIINDLEVEMKCDGFWQENPLPKSTLKFQKPFGADTMAFVQWLQFVFIPMVHELIKANGPWPTRSEVALYAKKEFASFEVNTDELLRLLTEADKMLVKKN